MVLGTLPETNIAPENQGPIFSAVNCQFQGLGIFTFMNAWFL